ncbi:nonribosomal peptide synthase [Penicillium malachiteum]|uniref:nonribosomal peptide synthase n=1 Tax=Penicillium malachiteum TaxID=1324776 RepID=UPI002548BA66|nr:nonribosomal peptide synthase [Penicillium malachiteum]KAJ5726010.1 nonribosomal peptide synthase [Penicillium malachiteum]
MIPDTVLSTISVFSDSDSKQIQDWAGRKPEPVEECVHKLVESFARETPNSPAIAAWDGEVSYKELDAMSSTLAAMLHSKYKVGPEVFVPLCFEKSKWMIISMLAVLKAGGLYCAITPQERLKTIAESVNASLVLISSSQLERHVMLDMQCLVVDQFLMEGASPVTITLPLVQPTNAAVTIFTSGSTGTPKGIVIEHRNICSSLYAHGKEFGFNQASRVFQFASYSFDIGYGDVFRALMFGGCLCVPSEYDRLNNLGPSINAFAANICQLTPTVAGIVSPREVPTLKTLLVGGEPISQKVMELWADKVRLIGVYGPSECTVDCLTTGPLAKDDRPGLIGHSLGARPWLVTLDNDQVLAPVGAVGEIIIEGPGVMREYLHDRKLTALVVYPERPWLAKKYGTLPHRLFKTGDIGYYQADGMIVCLGRRDAQVKLHGQRIEMGEIDAEAVVDIAQPLHSTRPTLTAFLHLPGQQGRTRSTSSKILIQHARQDEEVNTLINYLRHQLEKKLPSYMIPSAFIPLAEIPRNTSGKVDRRQLRQMSVGEGSLDAVPSGKSLKQTEPMTDIQRQTRRLLAGVLDLDKELIGLDDNFYSLGGDSLSAMRLVSEGRQMGLRTSVQEILKHPTLRELAATISVQTITDVPTTALNAAFSMLDGDQEEVLREAIVQCQVHADQIEDIYPCSPLQEGLMAVSMREQGTYITHTTMTLPDSVNMSGFKASWECIVQQFPILRTRIIATSRGFLQVVIREQLHWREITNPEGYIAKQQLSLTEPGVPLSTLAVCKARNKTQLIWTAHHAIRDGWSKGLIYRAVEGHFKDATIPPSFLYRDFIHHIGCLDLVTMKSYWTGYLDGFSSTVFPRLPSASYRPFADQTLQLGFSIPRKYNSKITMATKLYASWALLLSRYSDETDICFGTTLSGRTVGLDGIGDIVGPTIATVPIRIRIDWTESVPKFLETIQRQQIDSLCFEQIGLQNIAKLSSAAALACAFQSLFVIQDSPFNETDSDLFKLDELQDASCISLGHALTIEVLPSASSLGLKARYDAKIIDQKQMERILRQFETIFLQTSSAADDPDKSLNDIMYVDPTEIAELTQFGSGPVVADGPLLLDMIFQGKQKQSDELAIDAWNGSFTYLELDRMSMRLAHHLMEQGLQKGDPVMFCFEKSALVAIAVVGILRAGGVCVPVDPSFPSSRFQKIIATTNSKFACTSSKTSPILSGLIEKQIILDQNSFAGSEYLAMDLPQCDNGDQAYIIFTSGSTGEPKGIMMSHGSISSSIAVHSPAMEFKAGTRVLQYSAYTFDHSLFEILTTLANGGCICIPSDSDRMNNLAEQIRNFNITWAYLTPSVANLLKPEDVPNLKTLYLGGEQITTALIDTWAGSTKLLNGYGPAECSMCTLSKIEYGATKANIGQPISGRVWVTAPDNPRILLSVGMIGELLYEGPTMSQGYLNNPVGTQRSFIDFPSWSWLCYTNRSPSRLFRTGDLVRYQSDGTLEYIGRKDTLVKLHGLRVDLGEVEYQIKKQIPEFSEVIVDVAQFDHGKSDRLLAAFVRLEQKSSFSSSPGPTLSAGENQKYWQELLQDIETALLKQLPPYMVPRVFVPLSSLPHTTSEKVDRRTLHSWAEQLSLKEIAALRGSEDSRPPSSSTEKKLSVLWKSVLGADNLEFMATNNFLQIGGDSISAIRLVALAKREGLPLTVDQIMRTPRLDQMAASIDLQTNVQSIRVDAFELVRDEKDNLLAMAQAQTGLGVDMIEDIYPCTALQSGLMALSIKEPGTYVAQMVYRLDSSTDMKRFTAAWQSVYRSSPILRTRLFQTTSELMQVVVKDNLHVHTHDNLDMYLHREDGLLMMLGCPLFNLACIADESKGQTFAVITVHHAVYDGWSLSSLFEAVDNAYSNRPIIPRPGINVLIKYLHDNQIEKGHAYWESQLSGGETSHYPNLPSPSYRPIASKCLEGLLPFIRNNNSAITTATAMRTACAVVLGRYHDSTDIIFGETLSGRTLPLAEIDLLDGPTIATIPVRIRWEEGELLSNLLDRVQDQYINMNGYENYGLQHIQRISENLRDIASFQTLVIIQNSAEDTASGCQLLMTPVSGNFKAFHTYSLVLEFTLVPQGARLKVSFDPNIVSVEMVTILKLQIGHILRQLSDVDVHYAVSDLDWVTEPTMSEPAVIPTADERCLHAIVHDKAVAQPEAQAIVSWDGNLSYLQLDSLATLFSRFLQQVHGVQPRSFIPICAKKSLWSVVGMLAILKAGAAFVPIDPAHPKARIEYVVKTLDAPIILTTPETRVIVDGLNVPVVEIVEIPINQLPQTDEVCFSNAQPWDPAYCLFTSGSTGNPKGVVVQHASIVTSCFAHGKAMFISPESRVLQFAAYSFDISVSEIFATLLYGGCVCIPSETDRHNDVAKAINTMDVNWACLTPSFVKVLSPMQVPSLKTLVLAGEALQRENIATWVDHVRLINGYGPTEASVFCVSHVITSGNSNKSIIGRPVGCRAWVVSTTDYNKLAPLGATGELILEGPIVAQGYLKAPERTKAVFISNPDFLFEEPNTPLYRTGDLVRMDTDGLLEYIGRMDLQVKINGQRVELGEIEHQVKVAIDEKAEVIVQLCSDTTSKASKILVAFVSFGAYTSNMHSRSDVVSLDSSEEHRLLIDQARGRLTSSLPHYMIPSMYICVDFIPLNSSMKADRRKLEECFPRLRDGHVPMVSASQSQKRDLTELEKRLQHLWSKVLDIRIDEINHDANFFRQGGDSLSAIYLVAAAREDGLQLTVEDVFREPTLAAMTKVTLAISQESPLQLIPFSLIDETRRAEYMQSAVVQLGISDTDIEDIITCSPLQEGLVALSLKDAGAYIGQFIFSIPDAVDIQALEAAWGHTTQKIPLLRSYFMQSDDNRLVSVISRRSTLIRHETDLKHYLELDKVTPMGLGDPCVRLAIIRGVDNRHLVMSAHHAIYDAWSMQLILRTLEATYLGDDVISPCSFTNFLQYLSTGDDEGTRLFWQRELDGACTSVFPQLPSSDFQARTDKVIHRHISISRSNSVDVTLPTWVKLAWSLVLSRHSDRDDVCFGMTLSGRTAPLANIDRIAGPTITTVPIRVSLSKKESVVEFARSMQTRSQETSAFDHYGIQNIRKLTEDTARACSFTTLLVIQNARAASGQHGQRVLIPAETNEVFSLTYPLVLECFPLPTGISINASFDSRVLDSKTVGRILGQLDHVLHQLMEPAALGMCLADIELISPEDVREIMLMNQIVPPVQELCVHELFERQVSDQPSATAVESSEGALTYAALDEISSLLADYLVSVLHVSPGDFIPLLFEKSMWVVVVMLGVLKAGGACAALDPKHPASRLQGFIDDLEAKVILCSDFCSDKAHMLLPDVLQVNGAFLSRLLSSKCGITPLKHKVTPQDPAFVLFTSGSTGRPKGIFIDHQAFASSIKGHADILQFRKGSRNLQFTAYTSDVSIGEIFTSLAQGSCVCVPSEYERMNELGAFITRMNVDWAFLTPSVASLLHPADVPTLKTLVFGGETATPENVSTWAPALYLINSFGPAECSIWTSCSPGFSPEDHGSNIGYGVGCLQWIVEPDDINKLTPFGAIGELLIEGPNVASHYIKNPSKTASSFIKSPKWLPYGSRQRIYRTGLISFLIGDLARFLPDGRLQFIGRKDTQVKLHGQRVELGEIEHQLRVYLPSMKEIAVEMIQPAGGHSRLAAFLPMAKTSDRTDARIRYDVESLTWLDNLVNGLQEKLFSQLPSHMVPSLFIPMSHMPLSASAKTDRKALHAIASGISPEQIQALGKLSMHGNIEAPSTPMETILHGLWQELFNIDGAAFGVNHHFLRLGGDSILAMRLVTLCRTKGVSLSVMVIFQSPILKDMANSATFIEVISKPDIVEPFSLVPGQSKSELRVAAAIQCGVSPEEIEDVFPCTPLQAGLFSLSQRSRESYIARFIFEIDQCIDMERLLGSWKRVAQSHEILRTRFIENDDLHILQTIVKEPPECQTSQSLSEYLASDTAKPMIFGQPLFRWALVHEGGQNSHFVLSAHHSCYDAWSLTILLKSVAEIYHCRAPSCTVPGNFKAFIRATQKLDEGAAREFWSITLQDAPAPSFPALPSVSYQPITDATVTHVIQRPRQQYNAVPSSVLFQAAWSIVLARYSDNKDVVYGYSTSGRSGDIPGIESICGPTLATVPMRAVIQPGRLIPEFLNDIHRHSLERMPYEQFGLQNIMKSSPQVKQACNILTLLVVQSEGQVLSNDTVLGMKQVHLEDNGGGLTYALVLELTPGAAEIEMRFSFDSNVMDRRQVQRLACQFHHVLKQVFECASSSVDQIEIISPSDREEIFSMNHTVPRRSSDCVHELFERRVLSQPDELAISSWDGEMTYNELENKSTLLAQHLITRGVQSGQLVPLLFEKSLWTIVAMLAILKAGGACACLNPADPLERLQGVVEDMHALHILCSTANLEKASKLSTHVVQVDSKRLERLKMSRPTPVIDSNVFVSRKISSDQPAFILFSSGSTGKPKGIIIDHGAFSSSINGHSETLLFKKGSRNLQFTAYTSDVSIGEIFTSLAVGACVCVPSDYERMNDLEGSMERLRVDWAFLTPSVASVVDPAKVPTLKTLLFGGETATPENIASWAPQVYLINSFGPAECSIWTSCNPGVSITDIGSNVGYGLGCLQWIVEPEDHNKLAPYGTVGELLIEGPNVATGYLNNESKTKSTFISSPSWLSAGRRLYKTGDLARFMPDGKVQFLGRKDTQVKLHGQRIELREIEHQIRQVMDVQEVAVEMVGSTNGSQLLVAFLAISEEMVAPQIGDVPAPVRVVTPEETHEIFKSRLHSLQSVLSDVLPRHMIPTHTICLSNMPLSASAKTDRKALAAIFSDLSVSDLAIASGQMQSCRTPKTDMEQALHSLWVKVLRIHDTEFGLDDGFFHLGGDSISAMRLVSECRALSIVLSVENIFLNPRLQAMATVAQIDTSPLASGPTPVPPFSLIQTPNEAKSQASADCKIPLDEIEDIYPCSPLQSGLLALSLMNSGAYSSQFTYRVPTEITEDIVKDAWRKTVQSIDVLRTRIIYRDHDYLQVVTRQIGEVCIERIRNLPAYLQQDREITMTLGAPLARCGFIPHSGNENYVIITAHHAIYDAISWEHIIQTFQSHCRAQPSRAQNDVPFNHFIKFLGEQDLSRAATFWTELLQDCPASNFPHKLPQQVLTNDSCQRLIQLNIPSGSPFTLNTFLRAAWGLVCSSFEHSEDVIFGVTLSGRTAPLVAIDRIPGPTITTVPVRVSCAGGQTIEEYLDHVQGQANSMVPYEHFGLQNIQTLSPSAKIGVNFNSLLIVNKDDSDLGKAPVLNEFSIIDTGYPTVYTYPLVLECLLGQRGILVKAFYNTEMMPVAQVDRILSNFENTLQQLLFRDAHDRLAEMESISPGDMAEIEDWNGPMIDMDDHFLYDAFEVHASHKPDSLAVHSWDGELSYGELKSYSDRLGYFLQQQGLARGMMVPFCMEKSMVAIVTILAILKIGAACVPLDVNDPIARQKTKVDQVSAAFMLTSPTQVSSIENLGPNVLVIDISLIRSLDPTSRNLGVVSTTDIAYVMFTSGSTGLPKGVLQQHDSLNTGINALGKAMGITETSRVFQYASYTFDASIGDIFGALSYGGCICIPSEQDRLNDISSAINRLGANQACLTPTVARLLDPVSIPGLMRLSLGGEPITEHDILRWSPHTRLLNVYGITETAVWSATNQEYVETANIGRGFATWLWIIHPEDHNHLMPIGAIGEIMMEGPVLAVGYLNNEKATSAAFVTNVSWAKTKEQPRRFYKTGDLAYYNSDGTLHYVGRKDTQVKLHGQRVELGDIESHARKYIPGGVDLVVELIQTPSVDNSAVLVCFYDKADSVVDVKMIRTLLGTTLPSNMVPTVWMAVDTIPRLPSGKTDRKQLHLIFAERRLEDAQIIIDDSSQARRQPQTIKQRLMQELWAKVLARDPSLIGIDDDFFLLGGDSMGAMRLAASCREAGLSLTVTSIVQSSILAHMAEVSEYEAASSSTAVAPFSLVAHPPEMKQRLRQEACKICQVTMSEIDDIYPCTTQQIRYMKLNLSPPGCSTLQQPFSIPATVDIARLKAAWENVTSRNPILRTRVVQIDEEYYQVVTNTPVTWHTADSLETYTDFERSKIIQLGDLLSRVAIIDKRDGSRPYFVWTAHHAAFDAYSLQLTLNHLEGAYFGNEAREAPMNLLIKHTQRLASNPVSLKFWESQLAGARSKSLVPTSHEPAQIRATASAELQIHLPEFSSSTMTLGAVIHAAWSLLIAHETGCDESVQEVTLTGRSAPVDGILSIIGPAITIVPLRISIANRSEPLLSYMKRVQQTLAQIVDHEHVGYQNIQKISPDAAHAVSVAVPILIHPSDPATSPLGHGIGLQRIRRFPLADSPLLFNLECSLNATGFRAEVLFDDHLLNASVIAQWLQQLKFIVESLISAAQGDAAGRSIHELLDRVSHSSL